MKQVVIIVLTIQAFLLFEINAQNILKVKKWETIDIIFKTTEVPSSPFQEVMGCIIRSEDGNEMDIPGFYNGNSEWVVRFTPNKTGKWIAKSYSTMNDLSGKERIITVGENDENKHGGLIINPENPQHFTYESGKPYYLLAFEADWLFALDYGNPELPKTKQLVKHIRQNGFNHIVMNVYAFDVRWEKDPNLKPKHEYGGNLNIYPFGGTNQNPDHTTINIAFFKHLDRVIELLDENDLVAHLMIYVWNKQVKWPKPYSDEDNMYFDYVVKRYQAYNNIFWDISKEALGYGHDDINYITDRIDRLRKLDGYNRLVTVHDFGYCSKFPEKVDVISIQSWATNLYDNMLGVSRRFDNKPTFNIEHGGYERSQYEVFVGNYDNPEVCLRRNYLCAFAGTYSTYYWQAASWNVIIHDPYSEKVDPKPRFGYYKHFHDFMEKHQFHNLKPTGNLSASGMCLSNGEGKYIYYVPRENAAIDIKNLKKSDALKITWWNPMTDKYSKETKMPWSNYFRIKPAFEGVDNILIISAN